MIWRLALVGWVAVALVAHGLTVWRDVPMIARAAESARGRIVHLPLMVGGHWAMWPALAAHGRCWERAVIVTRQGRVLPADEYLRHATASPRTAEGFVGPCGRAQ